MKGCRPLTETEIQFVLRYFETVSTSFAHKPCQDRNKAIFLLGISTGLRVGELCGLRIRDVYADGKVVPDIYLEASMTKTKHARAVPLNRDARRAIRSAIKWQEKNFGSISPDKPLFPSEKGVCLKRMGVYFVLDKAFTACGIEGKVSTHSMRKTFATRLYEATNCLYTVKEILGHSDIESTRDYIGIPYKQLHRAVRLLDMSIPVVMSSVGEKE